MHYLPGPGDEGVINEDGKQYNLADKKSGFDWINKHYQYKFGIPVTDDVGHKVISYAEESTILQPYSFLIHNCADVILYGLEKTNLYVSIESHIHPSIPRHVYNDLHWHFTRKFNFFNQKNE